LQVAIDFFGTLLAVFLEEMMEIMGYPDTRPGKRSQKTNWKDPPFLMGKLTISMAMFNSYVTNYQRVENWGIL
jgi:hypothetical protein